MVKELWNGFCTAFAMYSVLPIKQVKWEAHTMKYALCFFPLVGAVIGLSEFLWLSFCKYWGLQPMLFAACFILLPIALSGGIHLDGLIDTADALCSRAEREKKLAILKDPHVGAFGVILCAGYLLLGYALAGQFYAKPQAIAIICTGFVISRAYSALAVASFQTAKASGLAYTFANHAQKKTVKITAFVYILLGYVAIFYFAGVVLAAAAIGFSILWFVLFRHMAYKQFSGLTGDLAGYFLCVAELLFLAVAALGSLV